jgi:hypothetical protein
MMWSEGLRPHVAAPQVGEKTAAFSGDYSLEFRCVYMIAIAWLYVAVLMAATEPSFTGGVLTFLCYGLGPLAIFLYVFGRRRRPSMPAREHADPPHRSDAKSDE